MSEKESNPFLNKLKSAQEQREKDRAEADELSAIRDFRLSETDQARHASVRKKLDKAEKIDEQNPGKVLDIEAQMAQTRRDLKRTREKLAKRLSGRDEETEQTVQPE